MSGDIMRLVVAILGFCALPSVAFAHHSFIAFYETDKIIEAEGEVTGISWRNPHVIFTIKAADSSGQEANWEIETNSLSVLGRMGVSQGVFEIGDRVKIAGQPARRVANSMFATNVLLADGQEILFHFDAEPRWTEQPLGDASAWFTDGTTQDVPGESRGIFRVWSTNLDIPRLFRPIPGIDGGFPLTVAAREARTRWDPEAENNPFLACEAGMPRIMNAITPMEIIDQGDSILIRIELYDARRTIRMGEVSRGAEELSALGDSVGHWEEGTLIVVTNRVDWPYFDQTGIPQSEAVKLTERFTPNDGGSRLDYELTIFDPATFTEPVIFERSWTWRPGEEVRPYECTL